MKRGKERKAHAYAVQSIRQLGRELTTGEWSPDNGALTTAEALTVIGLAMRTVVKLGVASGINAIDQALGEVLGEVSKRIGKR
jgi:hypothetical protein